MLGAEMPPFGKLALFGVLFYIHKAEKLKHNHGAEKHYKKHRKDIENGRRKHCNQRSRSD